MICDGPIVVWFRRDLRLEDNTALAAAAASSPGILPVWVLDERLLKAASQGPARRGFYLRSVAALDTALARLGSRLLVRSGDPEQVVPAVAREVGATAVYWNEDYTPFARRRDRAVCHALDALGIPSRAHADLLMHRPETVRSASGAPYTVYGAFRRAWQALPKPAPAPVPAGLVTPFPELPSEPLPGLPDAGRLPAAGEREARRLLDGFCREGIDDYPEQRNVPALDGVSRLSPHLRVGSLSPRQIYLAAWLVRESRPQARRGADTFLGELAWREFFYNVAYSVPRMLRSSFQPVYDGLRWRDDQAEFAAWCQGRTGFPFVDAAMRQLTTTGWMHNRARLVAGSFLSKDLLISWQWGERYFLQHLADGDPIVNNGNWQWVAGTGCDAAPYFRVFNPTLQARRFDPEGTYIRRFLPELRRVPTDRIHEPWTMTMAEQRQAGCLIGRQYPTPIVDHAAARERALDAYAAARHHSSGDPAGVR